MNLLVGLAALFSLVAFGSLVVFALTMMASSCQRSHELDSSTPTFESTSSSFEPRIADNLPEELRDWFLVPPIKSIPVW